MNTQHLVKMLNEISTFYVSQGDLDEAASHVESHVARFWEKRMRNQIIDHVKINLANRGLTVIPDASAGITAKAARASTLVVAIYSDFHEHAVALDALRVGDVIHLYGWEEKLKLPDGSTWTGGSGQEEIGERAFIAKVLMLQVGDRKVFGNWDAYGALRSRMTP